MPLLVTSSKNALQSQTGEIFAHLTDASLTADPGFASLIPLLYHTFVEIDNEIISTVILLPSAESFKKSCFQLQAKYVHEVLVNSLLKPDKEKVWLGELTATPWPKLLTWDVKQQNKQTKTKNKTM